MASPVSTPIRATAIDARTPRRRLRDTRDGVLMSLPAILGLIAFVAVPFIAAIVLSLYNVQADMARPPRFWGLTHYIRLFTDPVLSGTFLRSLLNNFVFAVVVIPVQTTLACSSPCC